MKIDRARVLQKKFPETAHLLDFYIQLIQLQQEIARDLQPDVRSLAAYFPKIRALPGPAALMAFPLTEDLLITEPLSADARFFWRVLTQPHAERYRKPSEDINVPRCPSCGSKPVSGVLRGEGDGARRALLCSWCALEWPYRRVICVNCGEEDKEKLPVYLADQIPHVRVEACDTCRTYIKSVDLTKDGFAVPQVDEIATVSLNLWAEEHEYTKVETNLLGM